MRVVNDVKYFSIGEVAKRIDRQVQTIRNWYKWAETQSSEIKDLPMPRTDIDKKGTRYFTELDITKLQQFKKSIEYGSLAEYNRTRWGKKANGQ